MIGIFFCATLKKQAIVRMEIINVSCSAYLVMALFSLSISAINFFGSI